MIKLDFSDPSYEIITKIFPNNLKTVPQLNEVYELELAYLESKILDDDEIIKNGAYFASVNGKLTRHFLMCRGQPLKLANHSSSRLKAFFQNNQFKTGYATHGLFPYRGKFHPQMIKALINIMGVKEKDMVLDPMMGSGTVLIEAKLMGINSIGLDKSPFCKFMTQAKIDALSVPLDEIKKINCEEIFKYFSNRVGMPILGRKRKEGSNIIHLDSFEIAEEKGQFNEEKFNNLFENEKVFNFLLLAYLDSAGYSERSNRKSPLEKFCAILERYIFVAQKTQNVLEGFENELGDAKPIVGDARSLPIDNSSIDGIIFSPPYSFAIDYIDNDAFHLKQLDIDIDNLKKSMIGLRGNKPKERYELYIKDMNEVLHECSRVLKKDKYCTIIVGTNNNQISKILNVSPEEVKGIDEILIGLGSNNGLKFVRSIGRQITGMANTMRTEKIVMLQKI